MASIFCPSCGAKSEYQFSAPNFCSKCGKSYVETHVASKSINSISQMRSARFKASSEQNEEDYDDNEESDSDDSETDSFSNAVKVPRIRKLDVEIDSSTDVRIIKFENLLNGNSNSDVFSKSKSRQLDDLID